MVIIDKCLLCGKGLRTVLDLGSTPLANELPARPLTTLERFPLRLVQCVDCRHLQIDCVVPKERLYRSYVYTTANQSHMRAYADQMIKRFAPKFVVDIGSNDGLFLLPFHEAGHAVLGVDPAEDIPSQVPRYTAFFGPQEAEKIRGQYGRADLVTCNNAFAHNGDLSPIVEGVKALISDTGNFVLEVAYALPMLTRGLFDLVYHEHVHHWLIGPMVQFFQKHGMAVYDAEIVSTHGGSLRVFVRPGTRGRPTDRMKALAVEEEALVVRAVDGFPKVVATEKRAATQTIDRLLKDDPAIACLGYPAKACTLLHHFGFGHLLRNVYDDNPKKIGKATPFGQIIRHTDEIEERDVIVASWNYADELMARFPGKRFFVPHPWRTL